MAHEIDHSTGRPAIAYVGEAPWHELGEKLPERQSIETWLKAARLQWELKRLPVQYLVDGRLRTMDDRFVLVRSDNQAALSVVSSDYQIVQPKEVLEFYRGLVESFGYTLETAGALDGGRKVWALAKTPIVDTVDSVGGDVLAAYVLLPLLVTRRWPPLRHSQASGWSARTPCLLRWTTSRPEGASTKKCHTTKGSTRKL